MHAVTCISIHTNIVYAKGESEARTSPIPCVRHRRSWHFGEISKSLSLSAMFQMFLYLMHTRSLVHIGDTKRESYQEL